MVLYILFIIAIHGDSNFSTRFLPYPSKIFISDGADGAFYPDEIQRPPVRVPSWGLEDNVVCSQPARNLSRPDGLEDPEDSKVN